MKVRMDFVTNSSSSSFIIATKKDTNKPTKDKLVELLNVPVNSPLRGLAQDMANILCRNMEKTTLEELLNNWGCENIEELPSIYQKAFKEGQTVYVGNVFDDDGGIEACLCDLDIDYEDDNIIISKNGGY